MKLALVAMPWAQLSAPSAALGCLSAALRAQRTPTGEPDHDVQVVHAYVTLAQMLGGTYEPLADAPFIGEIIYATHLFPDRRAAGRAHFCLWAAQHLSEEGRVDGERLFDIIWQATGQHLDFLADSLAANRELVGLTASDGQLMAALALGHRLKQRAPGLVLVLGGAQVSGAVGPSLIQHFDWIDHVVQGEGEARLLAIAAAPGRRFGPATGILSQRGEPGPDRPLPPFSSAPQNPDYDDYVANIKSLGMRWELPVETSRGCWWARTDGGCVPCDLTDRTWRASDPAELTAIFKGASQNYHPSGIRLVDTVLRTEGVGRLAAAIEGSLRRKPLHITHEVRPQIDPYEILQLWEAGCRTMYITTDTFSSRLLAAQARGTRSIQILQALRTAFELGIRVTGRLYTHIPGATRADVRASAEVIDAAASAYQPLAVHRFLPSQLGQGVGKPAHNAARFKDVFPKDSFDALVLPWRDAEDVDEALDWSPLLETVEQWNHLHRSLVHDQSSTTFGDTRPLFYFIDSAGNASGGDPAGNASGREVVAIFDRRHGTRVSRLSGLHAQLFLEATAIRSFEDLSQQVAHLAEPDRVREALAELVEDKVLFTEQGQYLTLPIARRPREAAERIRAARAALLSR